MTAVIAPLALALLPAAAGGHVKTQRQPPDPVSYSARVARDQSVWVDVENDSDDAIEVTSVVVSFYDAQDKLLKKTGLDCPSDCVVEPDEAGSFGPITGPEGWDTVVVTKVYYEPAVDAGPGRPVADARWPRLARPSGYSLSPRPFSRAWPKPRFEARTKAIIWSTNGSPSACIFSIAASSGSPARSSRR